MKQERQFPARREAQVVLLWLLLVMFTIAFVLSTRLWINDVRGATVDAHIVSITTNVPGRRVYDIRLVTSSGRVCVTKVDSGSNPPPREIHVGGTSRVHYPASNPCAEFSVRETTTSSAWPVVVLSPLAIAVTLIFLWRLRRSRRRNSGPEM